ncbi:MAG: DUF655 domain-containing protein [Nanobdellota archaeon]
MTHNIREEWAVTLDFLPNGYPLKKDNETLKTPIAQAIGKERFVLLELIPKKGVFLQPYQETYIGDGKREKIHHIKGRLKPEELTQTANSELKYVIKDIIKKNEKKFVDFFNNSRPLSTRMHQLELLPGLGKKHMWEIIEARRDKPFESLQDMKERIKLLPKVEEALVKRIINELSGKEKHYLFTDSGN